MAGLTWLHLSDWHQKGKEFNREVVRDREYGVIGNMGSGILCITAACSREAASKLAGEHSTWTSTFLLSCSFV
jgi:hypothetical protein